MPIAGPYSFAFRGTGAGRDRVEVLLQPDGSGPPLAILVNGVEFGPWSEVRLEQSSDGYDEAILPNGAILGLPRPQTYDAEIVLRNVEIVFSTDPEGLT